ncbi:protein insensitive-like [Bactrocera dorsalis]|uniref:Protein insensitive-like n=1 Tax=Bactrocera dorsalis TaxID=27457 RepID=A0ABM3JBW5_BACDO|nr:protein insensitive-like [Bactrocera dorsalis]
MSGNIYDFMASPELKRRNEVEDYKKQRLEAPIPQNPENDLQAIAIEEEAPREITLGPSGTTVKENDFERIRWFSAALATRNLLTLLFDEETLATHTINRLSHTFHLQDRVLKPTLDFEKVSDAIYCIQRRFGCSEMEVRELIIMTCSNMARTLQSRRI